MSSGADAGAPTKATAIPAATQIDTANEMRQRNGMRCQGLMMGTLCGRRGAVDTRRMLFETGDALPENEGDPHLLYDLQNVHD
jgi:hypothetical protein